MYEKMNSQSIQATMLIPLYGRTIAGRRFPGILRDTAAERIVDSVDFDFSGVASVYGTEYAALTCLVRAARMDECARVFLSTHPDGTVVNLGAGLDDTFSRVDNGAALWYNLDLPDAIAYREQFFAPTERCRNIAKSMFDYTWLDDIGTPEQALVLAAGLFFYFEESEIRRLVEKICEHFPACCLVFESCSRRGMKIANKLVRKTGITGAEMKCFVNNAAQVKGWSPKISSAACLPFFEGRYKDKRFSLLTRFLMWGADFLCKTKFVVVRW
ncbi:MAG: class I SAM-dependent methyltransferase [Spirochaetaceae bacterium]|jgi:O-methyltransferase involved in polyketide biosynthesis|nr:class I SAM-dependent methyltransferase [Spirochaetaceae bacterium]